MPLPLHLFDPSSPQFRRPENRTRINLREPAEVAYWTKALGCTPEALRNAVAAVGPSAERVCEALEEVAEV
jgi:hypothetical protein